MSIKTIQAKSLNLRVGFAYAGTESAPIEPTMATAYKRAEGVITIALVKGGVIEVSTKTRVRYSTNPVADGATYLRWCRKCEETHLLRVGTDIAATLYCDVRTKAIAVEKEQGTYVTREQRENEEREARIARVLDRVETPVRSRDALIDITLRNVARDLGLGSQRFAVVAAQYGLTVADASTRALRELDKAGLSPATA